MNQQFWQQESDGLIYAEPKGFSSGYYIYPPNYDEESPIDKYSLYLIKESDNFNPDDVRYFATLEQAKEYAISKFKSIIKPFLHIFT